MNTYETPRVTFVGADPKIPALRKAIERCAVVHPYVSIANDDERGLKRFIALWQARNRRTRVLMARVMHANAAR